MASHLLPLTLSVTVVIDVRHAYIITLPALFINPSDYLTVTQVFMPMVSVWNNRAGIPFVKTLSLLCKLIQF